LLGNGNGSFTLKANPGTGTSDLIAGVTGDYNGDGKLDFVVSDRTAGEAFLLPGVGDGTFGPKLTFTTAAGAFGVATADFNGDGGLDLAVANGSANNVSIFLQLLPVDLNPTSLSFGNILVGSMSNAQPVTLPDSSGGTLDFFSCLGGQQCLARQLASSENARIRFVDGVKFLTIAAAFKDLGSAGGIVFSDRPETFALDPFAGQDAPLSLILGRGRWTTNIPLRIGRGNNQRIFGRGPRSTILAARPQFPANSALLSIGKPGGGFGAVVHGIGIDTNNVPGATGLNVDGTQEDCGTLDFIGVNATNATVRFSSDQRAGATQNTGIEQFEIAAGGTSADGVRIEGSTLGEIYIRNFTINNNKSEIRCGGDGIRIFSNPGLMYMHYGHTVDNLVEVNQHLTGYTLENVGADGAGIARNDANRDMRMPGAVDHFSTSAAAIEFTMGDTPYAPWVVSDNLMVVGNVTVKGSLKVTGTKSSAETVADSREVNLYEGESPGNWLEDFGAARLQGGAGLVFIDPTFMQSVNTELDYHVVLMPNADGRSLYVAHKFPACFKVREVGGGHSNIAFGFRIVARRRGYEQPRPASNRETILDEPALPMEKLGEKQALPP
jgi:hypothetical protein